MTKHSILSILEHNNLFKLLITVNDKFAVLWNHRIQLQLFLH